MSSVDDVKQRIDIVDLVSQHVTLKRAGRGYTGLCPFHTEKTPSFHVDPARQSWHCFGACSTGGDIFSFVMKKEGVEFGEALRTLAEQAGVQLETRRDTREDAQRARLFEINEMAAAFFHASLGGDGADPARAYLQERGLATSSVEKFQIGYAPNSWDALLRHLEPRSVTAAEAASAGLAVEGERGTYDRFRHRMMFPIRDDRGRIVGFGGRILPGDALGSGEHQAKYVNTSQSPVFDKGALLYALDLAKEAIRAEGCAVIVEGYMDVIAAHERGYANVVASMGTALTERQVTLLKRHAPRIVLALDADNAGSEATIRSAYEIINNSLRRRPVPNARGIVRQVDTIDIDLRVLSLPEGRDPDDVIRAEGDVWPELVRDAPPVLDHLFHVAEVKRDLTQPRERSAMVAELAPFIALTADRVVQSHYLQRLSRLARTDEATLRLELKAPVRGRQLPREQVPDQLQNERTRARMEDTRETFCLALLIQYPELRAEASGLDPEFFRQSENRELFEIWSGRAEHGEPIAGSLSRELQPHYERILTMELPGYDGEGAVRALHTTIWNIEQQRMREAKRARASTLDASSEDAPSLLERARSLRDRRVPGGSHADDEGDPAAAFVEDMEAGRQIHQHLMDTRRVGRTKPRGGA
jgi:DNA primase